MLLVAGLIAAYIAIVANKDGKRDQAVPPPGCHVSLDATTYTFGVAQTAHATTIAAVGKRMGLPDHAVTVAIASALQESQLHNLDHGDRDSLGLFQQRPSQGWGTPEEIMTPHYAAAAFFDRLARVEGWEIPIGLTCWVDAAPQAESNAPLRLAIAHELGEPALDVPVPYARGWTVASWLIAHSAEFGIMSVSYSGQIWTPTSGQWLAYGGPPDAVVRVSQESA